MTGIHGVKKMRKNLIGSTQPHADSSFDRNTLIFDRNVAQIKFMFYLMFLMLFVMLCLS